MENPKQPYFQEGEQRRRVVVKFLDDFNRQDRFKIPYEDGAERSFPDDLRKKWEELSNAFPEVTLRRLYTTVSSERILELVGRAKRNDESFEPPNFLTFFAIDISPEFDPYELAKALLSWEEIEYAYVQSIPAPLPNPLQISQRYQDPPNYNNPGALHIGGIDAENAWTHPGGSGAGINIIIIERAWKLDHVDLSGAAIPQPLGGTLNRTDNPEWVAHGTSVLGIVVAQDNTVYCKGIAYDATTRVVSEYDSSGTPNIPGAIMTAIDALQHGDVILIELQICQTTAGDPCDSSTLEDNKVLVPVELESPNFEAIRLATALGIVVVEAAGNGSRDLCALTDNLGQHIFDPDLPQECKDSGAIIVAAAIGIGGHRATRTASSNYGSRVNLFAWGSDVSTLDVILDPDTPTDPITGEPNYVDDDITFFGGTSAASAICAGAATLAQSLANSSLGSRLDPLQLRNILIITGTPSIDPLTDQIGVMPNLQSLKTNILDPEAISDVYIRDHIGDTGDPHTGPISASPDVIVRAETTPNPSAFAGTATINNDNLGSTVTANEDHFVYVRVLNRGADATGVRADVYYTPPTTLPTPAMWRHIGTTVGGTSVSSDTIPLSITVLDPISWPASELPPADDGFDHYCFIATIWSDDDPNPLPNAAHIHDLLLMDLNHFYALIRNNNNVAWRNFNVVEVSSGEERMEMAFMVSGWPKHDEPMQLDIVAQLSEEASAWLEGPAEFMETIVWNRRYLEKGEKAGVFRVPINSHGLERFKEVVFPAELQAQMRLLVNIPKGEREHAYEIFARQLYSDVEIGRVTWRLVPPNQIQTFPLRFLFSELWNHVRFRLRLGRART